MLQNATPLNLPFVAKSLSAERRRCFNGASVRRLNEWTRKKGYRLSPNRLLELKNHLDSMCAVNNSPAVVFFAWCFE